MPELPEVEARRKVAERHLAGRRIIQAAAAPDRIVFEGVRPRTCAAALTGRRVVSVRRKGKHLWLELDRRPWPTLHFGMGGHFAVYRERDERPRFWKLEMVTEEGVRVAMTNARRLGRIRLQHDPPHEVPIRLLGRDPLDDLPRTTELARLLERRTAPIKAVLLDQSVLAGIGNWIADEVLYQARISPRRPADTLERADLARLRARIGAVIRRAVAVDADSDRFPRSWLFHVRWGKSEGARTARGERIVFGTVGGRTTAWVPSVQK
jgi:formamidopyrimidine-DNA glycosylase